MENKLQNPLKIVLLLASFLMVGNMASATTYTAAVSGNWSSAATWGGSAPPANITGADQINIGVGITVTMDQNVTLNNGLASISVAGILSGAPYIKLDVLSGTVSGSGTINDANVTLGSTGYFSFSGSMTVDTLTNSILAMSNSSQIMVNDELDLAGAVNIIIGGSLTMGNNSRITISGGGLAVTGGSLNLSSTYNVDYTTTSANTGMELTGAGLGNVTVNVGSTNNVTLTANLTTNSSLNMVSGSLMLNGYNLTINGAVTGSAIIGGSTSSNLAINTPGGLSAPITFSTGLQNLNALTVSVGSGYSVGLSSDLNISGTLALTGGSRLNINGQSLTIDGDLSGNGSLMVNSSSRLNLNTSNSITGNISFVGINLGKFTLNIGNGNRAVLATNLAVDTLDMASGTVVLNGHNLAVNADISTGGAGVVASTSASNISVASSIPALGQLSFSASADSVNNLTVNVSGGAPLTIGSNLFVNGTLAFTAGLVNIQSNNLMIGAAGSISGAGPNAYIITGNGGYLTMYAAVSNTTTFHVGTASNYFPADITLNTGSSTGTIGVNVSAGVYSNGSSGAEISTSQPMVDATWLFQNNIGSGINANMKLSWEASAEVNGFVHTDDYISHYASAWDDIGDSMTAVLSGSLYSVTRASITSMSPFAVFDQATVPTGINEIAKNQDAFLVYPNPANYSLYVKNSEGNGATVYVEVYNTIGQMVAKTQYNNDLLVLPVSSLPVGNYFLKLYNDKMTVVKKFNKL